MDKEPLDLHHLSAIRIGDRIVYNGVGGNAFAFGEKPDLVAFALGPYPNPNSPGLPLSKSRTEPDLHGKGTDLNLATTQTAEDVQIVNHSDNEEGPTIIIPPSPLSVSSISTREDKIESQQQVTTSNKNIVKQLDTGDKTALQSLSDASNNEISNTSSASSSKKNKANKKPTLKEVARQADCSRTQYERNSSWGAITNLGSRIASNTTYLMTSTAGTTIAMPDKTFLLPAPPSRQPQPTLPLPDTLAATSSKYSSPASSKASSASSTPTKSYSTLLEGLTVKRERPRSIPSPASLGLPPILPRPPAAHLPPPLPSRPPASLLLSCPSSPCSSIKSSASQLPSPDDGTDTEDNEHNEVDDTANNKETSLIYRSSGTIRLENSQMPSSPSPKSDAKNSTFKTQGDLTQSSGRRHSQSSFICSVKTSSEKKSTSVKDNSFSTISAMIVGASCRNTEPSNNASNSHRTEPIPLISHQVSVSTPNLRDITDEPSSAHSSDDEGVFEGALSASDEEVTASDACGNKNKNEPTPSQRTKMDKQRLPDIPKSSEVKTFDKKQPGNGRNPETDMASVKNKRIWPFHKKTQEKKDNGDFDKTLTIDDAEQKRIEKDNMEKDNLSFGATTKKSKKKSPTKDNASNCRRCRVKFSFRCVRHHCNRCRLAFCINCAPVSRCDMGSEEQGSEATSLVKLCAPCKDELIFENSRGATRGLWSEFQKFRAEARNNRGLDVTSSTLHKHLESQTVLDVTPGLRNLCIKFLVTLHQQLQKQPRHKFLANYLHFENPIKQQVGNMKKVKNCHACDRYLRIMSDIRECGICKQVFCMACTWKTLQLYLPKGTDLRADINLEMIHFHIKETEVVGKDEVTAVEASELYRVCASCEDVVARNIHVYEFDAKVPQLEAELFDLQRQIDHCLTFSPYMLGIQPTTQLTKLSLDELMGTCVKHANNLYERYTRAYEILNNLMPQTGGQKALHKHIKQAMYDFYLKRRNQLNATFRDTDSCEDITAETGKSDKTSSPVSNL